MLSKRARDELPSEPSPPKLDVAVVCCGQPKLSMGWFHLTQLLDEPSVNVCAVVEPFFLGAGKDSAGAAKFSEMRASLGETHPGISFYATAEELPTRTERTPMLALIAGRTCE